MVGYEESVTIIPSLHDIKSQKTLRDILQAMGKKQVVASCIQKMDIIYYNASAMYCCSFGTAECQ